jgi:hypothetical protein
MSTELDPVVKHVLITALASLAICKFGSLVE